MFVLVQICDMVTIARHLNVTLIVPELDKTSFWADPRFSYFLLLHHDFSSGSVYFHGCLLDFLIEMVSSFLFPWCGSEFQDIFDVDNFIGSLRDEVRILKELPPRLKRRVEQGLFYSLPPVSWSNISYYEKQVFTQLTWLLFFINFLVTWIQLNFLLAYRRSFLCYWNTRLCT